MKTRHLVPVVALGWLAAGCAHTTEEARGTTTTTVAATGGERVVITERPADPAATVRGEVRHSFTGGRITDVDLDDGTVKVRMPDGSEFELEMPPVAGASIREGDGVTVDITVHPR